MPEAADVLKSFMSRTYIGSEGISKCPLSHDILLGGLFIVLFNDA